MGWMDRRRLHHGGVSVGLTKIWVGAALVVACVAPVDGHGRLRRSQPTKLGDTVHRWNTWCRLRVPRFLRHVGHWAYPTNIVRCL